MKSSPARYGDSIAAYGARTPADITHLISKPSNKTRLRRFVGDCYIDRVTTGSEEAILEESSKDVRSRLEEVRLRMEKAARRRHRSPDEIKLIAVSKTHPPAAVRHAIACGIADLGENRVQEAEEKIPAVGRALARWHLVGHLQSNKARKAVELFDVIHSLDSVALAQRLDRICGELDRQKLPVLIQVDLGHEATKTGVDEKNLSDVVAATTKSSRLSLIGLMTLPPFFDEAETVRPYFRRLRELRDELQAQGAFGEQRGELSMGMTNDFEIAIEEGATMIRVGTAIFGPRERAH